MSAKWQFLWTFILLCVGIGITYLMINMKSELAIAPDIHMVNECDSFRTAVHVTNLDKKAIRYSYRVCVDTNNDSLLDSTDVFLYSESNLLLPPGEHRVGMVGKPMLRYKPYSLIVELKTDELIEYYLSIPCD